MSSPYPASLDLHCNFLHKLRVRIRHRLGFVVQLEKIGTEKLARPDERLKVRALTSKMENVAIRFPFVADIALEVIALLLSAATDDIPAEGMVRIPDGQLPSPFLHRRPERNDIKPV